MLEPNYGFMYFIKTMSDYGNKRKQNKLVLLRTFRKST